MIRIGVIAPFSGPLAENFGRPIEDGARLAAKQANDADGLDVGGRRHRIELLFEDSLNRPEVAVDVARKLINQGHVAALVGPSLSHNAIAAAAVAEEHRLPMISPSATHRDVTAGRRYAFRVAVLDEVQARAVAHFAGEDLGAQTAAVLYDVTTAYSRDVAEIFQRAFEEAGGRVVAFESYTAGEQDFLPFLTRIRDAEPDVLLLPNYAEVPVQIRQAREIGIGATFLGTDSWDSRQFSTRELFEGAFFVDSWHPETKDPRSRAFVEAFRQLFGREPRSAAAATYDALGLLFQAMAGLDRLDGAVLRRALAGIEGYRGATGTISYRGGGDPVKGLVIVRITGGEASFHQRVRP